MRLVKVTRHPDRHDLREVTVDVQLEGDFEAAHVHGDNRKVLPTDTMKNTVYALAKERLAEDVESFGLALAEHFLAGHAHVSRARVRLVETPWARLEPKGRPHPHAFTQASGERRTASIAATRQAAEVESGIDGLLVLKTSGSGFEGFLKDSLTTLEDTRDRILKTAIRADWSYARRPASFGVVWQDVRRAILAAFADHESRSVQHTLYAMGEAALVAREEISEIHLSLPNQHCLLVDLARLGLENRNEIFVPVDEPHGLIDATVRREAPAGSS